MTLVVTVATERGIVMGSDSLITYYDPRKRSVLTDKVDFWAKTEWLDAPLTGVSIWGRLSNIPLKTGTSTTLKDIIKHVQSFNGHNSNVFNFATCLRDHINSITDVKKLGNEVFGVHLAGYVDSEPKVFHVCLSPDDDKDAEQHDPNFFKANDESSHSDEPPFAMVFNGFHQITSLLTNAIPNLLGQNFNPFKPRTMGLDRAVAFVRFLLNVTEGFQRYVTADPTVGGRKNVLVIKRDGRHEFK